MIKKIQKLALVFSALVVATQPAAVSAADPKPRKCTVGKQTYQFLPFEAGPARLKLKDLKKLDAETKAGYTEVEWTYFNSEKPSKALKRVAINCGSSAFIKIGDIDTRRMKSLVVTGDVYIKEPFCCR